jgi:hypothetical protein
METQDISVEISVPFIEDHLAENPKRALAICLQEGRVKGEGWRY